MALLVGSHPDLELSICMLWQRFIILFIAFILGKTICFPNSERYIELADSADFFIQRENWDKAEATILEALRLEPANFSNSMLLANLGLVQTHKGEYNKAIESLTLGLNIAPSSTVLLNNRAHTYILSDNLVEAIKDLDKTLEIDSIQEWPLVTRAFLYLDERKIPEAKNIFFTIKEKFPGNSSVYVGLATIAEKEGNIEEAKSYYREALLRRQDDEEAREAYIYLLIKSNEYSLARAEIRSALNINPENPMFYLLRGYLHRLNYRNDEAQADKKIAISKGIDASVASSFIP